MSGGDGEVFGESGRWDEGSTSQVDRVLVGDCETAKQRARVGGGRPRDGAISRHARSSTTARDHPGGASLA
jgi:hypothetical protein